MSAALSVAAKLRITADTVEVELADQGAGPHSLADLPAAMREWADELDPRVVQLADYRSPPDETGGAA